MENKVYDFGQTRARLEHREIILYGFNNEKTFRDHGSGFVVECECLCSRMLSGGCTFGIDC